ncbi:reverse transcriptase-like protein [Salimicrobium flavidum]|uniref:Ribonuclease HI n=1 Tax=Salimicrobium flavidum TaxID=570947 RepID=A0A1N7IRG1_9BACI|nr:reverse transcriptase-like protein [Salimicrobium flavidum]SIS39689.1 ribonuclease HI [Salimicrobium flavidum]
MKITLHYLYKVPKGPSIACSTEEMDIEEALKLETDLHKVDRIRQVTFRDRNNQERLRKELKTYIEQVETEPHNVRIYFDGGYEMDTERAGLGCIIYYDKNGSTFRIRKNALVDELESSNEAEYAALHLAIQQVEMLGVRYLPAVIRGDSRLVINQMSEEWACYDETLLAWADRIDAKLTVCGLEPNYEHIPRKENWEADRLATQALEGIMVESHVMIE